MAGVNFNAELNYVDQLDSVIYLTDLYNFYLYTYTFTLLLITLVFCALMTKWQSWISSSESKCRVWACDSCLKILAYFSEITHLARCEVATAAVSMGVHI